MPHLLLAVHRLTKGSLVRIDGPANVRVLSGRVHVMGAEYGPGSRFTVLRARRVVVKAIEDSDMEFILGPEGSVDEASGEDVVDEWESALSRLRLRGVVLVMGTMDVGKTTLTVVLANRAVREGLRVGVIDADPGQNDLGPPTTVSSALLEGGYITHLRQLRPLRSIFVKTTSVEHVKDEVSSTVKRLVHDLESAGSELIVINTDGWVSGEGAVDYKCSLVRDLRPNYVIVLRRGDEVDELIKRLSGENLLVLPALPTARVRSREDRRIHREMGYGKYLWPGRDLVIDLRRKPIVNLPLYRGVGLGEEMRRMLASLLGARVNYAEQFGRLVVAVGSFKGFHMRLMGWGSVAELPIEWERGILVSLEDEGNYLLTLGMLRRINYENGRAVLVIPRSFEAIEKVHHVRLGMIRLNDKFEEVERANFIGKIEAMLNVLAPGQLPKNQ
jgi:polynucleotide 5'-hydroxyl-kinase GRC3/NOL9